MLKKYHFFIPQLQISSVIGGNKQEIQLENRMNTLTKSLTIIIVTVLFGGEVLAGTPGVNKRQDNQQARISQGIKSGELTAKESARMVKGQVELQRMENRAKRDGKVTKKERVRLHRKANVESGKIYRNKHDGQKRPKARG